ncbi:hypothetical protein OEA41_006944 [Lepraria neglecta]|uniref:DNA replication regulator SLD2 n=1 Tax=Lepraria neglecta TaxID=209136 RepID=A0AAD9ZB95_9LECA|nr:hypothetical protein OEA41_006944 [Lepraria neglecta]
MAASTTELSTETQVILTALRQELKAWETSFAAAHEGRKAGREDIKQHPDIEEKYKQYNRLRHPSQQPPASKTATPTKKRHRSTISNLPPSNHTPSKRLKSNHSIHDSIIATYDSPTSTYLSPTTHRTSIGPTPQKDGQVLGLFDRLSTSSKDNTPSKRYVQLSLASRMQTTPSKRSSTQDREPVPASTGKRRHKSPLSASKQTYLNTFLTPSANRVLNSHTPSSRNGVSKLRFDETPAFLRRDSQRAYTGKENETLEEDISWSPVMVRKLPKPAGRGLSTLVKGLRDMEDEKLDEELEMLREMEGDYAPSSKAVQPKILVDDSQRPDMPLGPDGGGDSEDSEIEKEGKGRDGKPLKVWKKKGQKRTTRRVLMKPNVAKWKPEPAWKGEAESEDDGQQAVVEETLATMQGPKGDEDDYEDELATDHEMEESNNRKNKTTEKSGEKKEGFAAKVRKKISATAHANFRALKIKNKQSKGKGGGRFGRRR